VSGEGQDEEATMDVKGAQALRERLARAALADGPPRADAPETADAGPLEVEGDPTGGRVSGLGDLRERELLPSG
jgi:hypothetical protein